MLGFRLTMILPTAYSLCLPPLSCFVAREQGTVVMTKWQSPWTDVCTGGGDTTRRLQMGKWQSFKEMICANDRSWGSVEMFEMMLQDVPGRNSPHTAQPRWHVCVINFFCRESVYSWKCLVNDAVRVCSSLPKDSSNIFYLCIKIMTCWKPSGLLPLVLFNSACVFYYIGGWSVHIFVLSVQAVANLIWIFQPFKSCLKLPNNFMEFLLNTV